MRGETARHAKRANNFAGAKLLNARPCCLIQLKIGDKMTDYLKYARFMERLARDAEKIYLKHKKSFKIIDKGVCDVVTDVDLIIERHCIDEIQKAYPSASIVSEEFNSDEIVTESCFTIDPIDGTKNFSHGLPFWGFQMAYFENGNVVASVINCPELKLFITAFKGGGTFCNGKRVQIHDTDFAHSMWLLDGNEVRRLIWDDLAKNTHGARSLGGSAPSYALVLAGRGLCLVNKKAFPWDIFPGFFACENAGFHCAMLNNGFQIVAPNKEILDYAISKLDVPINYENTKLARLYAEKVKNDD